MSGSSALKLNVSDAGSEDLVIVLHGFLGSGRNWQTIAKQLANDHHVVWADLRNHGASPWSEEMTYLAMASDILALIDHYGAERASLIGHSMGGKAAMMTALLEPQRVARLAVVDIAPVAYDHGFQSIIGGMRSLDLDQITARRDADEQLKPFIGEAGERAFVLQNLDLSRDKARWRCNLEVLAARLPDITGWAVPASVQPFTQPALFLYGACSDYVGQNRQQAIEDLFPAGQLQAIADAGHWLHAEQPAMTTKALGDFLQS